MKVSHVFFTQFGVEYKDYTAYVNIAAKQYSEEKYPIVLGPEYRNKLCQHIDELCNQTFVPALGDKIHVVPDCKLAIQDLRNNYKLKREPDSGTCNVFSNIGENKGRNIRYHHFIIDHNEKIIVCLLDYDKSKTNSELKDELFSLLPGNKQNGSFDYYYNVPITLSYLSVDKCYYHLLTNSLTKPCIYYEKLPLKRNPVTSELLYTIWKLGHENDGDYQHKNYIMQLSILAQTEWKKYPGTMNILFGDMLKYRSPHYEVSRNYRLYPKQIREIVSRTYRHNPDFSDDEDYKMCQKFLEHIFNIGDGFKFVSLTALQNKLLDTRLDENNFNLFYDGMVKINLKKGRCEE